MTEGSITFPEPTGAIPKCVCCGTVRESWTGDPCQCPGAQERRTARESLEKEAMKAKPTASIAPPLPRRDDGLAILRREAKREQELAARVKARDDAWQDVLDQRLTLAQADIAERVTAREADGQTAEGLTLADFRHEVTLLGVDRLPSALDRIDGETLAIRRAV